MEINDIKPLTVFIDQSASGKRDIRENCRADALLLQTGKYTLISEDCF